MRYEAAINSISGNIGSILKTNDDGCLSIPLCPGNTDFDKFCVWNKRNNYPIEIPAEIMATIDMDLIEQIHGSEVP
jgi:hypothetical protein